MEVRVARRQPRWIFVTGIALASMLVLGACGRPEPETTANESTTTAPAQTASSADFGTLTEVCQEGSGGGATATGVSADTIRIATFSDAGSTVRPGLNQELFDAADVFASWCNDNGGINGRMIEVVKEDAALFDVPARMADACQNDVFFVVGGGAAFDDTGEETRLQCMLPSVPGYVASATSRDTELAVQPVPNPNSATGYGQYRWLKEEYPKSVEHLGVLTGDIPTTKTISDQSQEAAEALGFEVVYSDKYPAAGTVTWTPYVA
jgi:hypothetical protein